MAQAANSSKDSGRSIRRLPCGRALMRSGEHDVARSYVLYREERSRARAQEKVAQKAPAANVLNVLDRVNLIRPQNGIGIFQSAYGPRLTFYDTITLHF